MICYVYSTIIHHQDPIAKTDRMFLQRWSLWPEGQPPETRCTQWRHRGPCPCCWTSPADTARAGESRSDLQIYVLNSWVFIMGKSIRFTSPVTKLQGFPIFGLHGGVSRWSHLEMVKFWWIDRPPWKNGIVTDGLAPTMLKTMGAPPTFGHTKKSLIWYTRLILLDYIFHFQYLYHIQSQFVIRLYRTCSLLLLYRMPRIFRSKFLSVQSPSTFLGFHGVDVVVLLQDLFHLRVKMHGMVGWTWKGHGMEIDGTWLNILEN